jgi:putative membrane protein
MGVWILIRLGVSAVAIWLATLIISGIRVTAETTWGTIGTFVVVALLIGIVNAVLRPVIKLFGCAFYVLTLGLIALVVNGFLLMLVYWFCRWVGIPFEVDNFWPSAVLGALIIGVASWAINLVVERD